MALYDNLFDPLPIGNTVIKNRIVRSPHGTGLVGDDLIAYHEARAKGGVALSTIQATGVHPGSPSGIPLFSDSCKPFLTEIADRMRPHDMKLLIQLFHGGAGNPPLPGIAENWSASAIPNPLAGVIPMEMTKTMIDDVIAGFAAAAVRVRDSGLDGVDIHASSGYLIHEFLSPALNRRNDEYGGSLQNRMRFMFEVIGAVRDAVGEDIVVGVRLPNEDYVPGGLTAEDNAAIASAVEPVVDYISLHMGSYWRFHRLISPADEPLGVEMKANQVISPGLSKPVMVTGRIMTLDHASSIVASGEADMVSMVRALIADPELVNKARRREEHRIRPCIGSNMGCVGQLMTSGRISCVVNSSAAREQVLTFEPQDRVTNPKNILVVGGGPAGLEFARTAALRGHNVELHEAMKTLGGQVIMAASAPKRADIGTIVQWLADEIESLGVDVHLNSYVDEELIAEKAPDEVVLATGTMPRVDGMQQSDPGRSIEGFDLPHVYSSWDILGFGEITHLQGPAVIYDDTGSFEAISVADVLLQNGLEVTMVSRNDSVGSSLPYPPVTAGAARERLYSGEFDFIGAHYIRRIARSSVDIGVLFTDRKRTVPAKTVVFVGYNEPNRELWKSLQGNGPPVHMIGDVRGRNSMMTAIHAGAELGRRI
ncbi:MAG: FAD-dependent oxidoreductase [Gammaproteobacteria bacterium]|nr:FAD-dependent oxidoreductase [Gammaproteobacteria bacterium]